MFAPKPLNQLSTHCQPSMATPFRRAKLHRGAAKAPSTAEPSEASKEETCLGIPLNRLGEVIAKKRDLTTWLEAQEEHDLRLLWSLLAAEAHPSLGRLVSYYLEHGFEELVFSSAASLEPHHLLEDIEHRADLRELWTSVVVSGPDEACSSYLAYVHEAGLANGLFLTLSDDSFVEVWRRVVKLQLSFADVLLPSLALQVHQRGLHFLLAFTDGSASSVLKMELAKSEPAKTIVCVDGSGSVVNGITYTDPSGYKRHVDGISPGDVEAIVSTLVGDYFSGFGAKVPIHGGQRCATCRSSDLGGRSGTHKDSKGSLHRISSLLWVGREALCRTVAQAGVDHLGFATNNFTSSTDHRRIIDTALKAAALGSPYILVIVGDGGFNDLAKFKADLATHADAFASCMAIIFNPLPHTPDPLVREMESMFIEFNKTATGCIYHLCRTPGEVNAETVKASSAQSVPGYRTLLTPSGPLYLVDAPRRVITRLLASDLDLMGRVGDTLVSLAEGAGIQLLVSDPVFSSLYGAIKMNRKNDDLDVAEKAISIITRFSGVKGRVIRGSENETILNHLIDTADDDEERVEAMQTMLAGVNEGSTSLYEMRTLTTLSGDDFRLAKRELAGDGLIYSDAAHSLLDNLFIVEAGSFEGEEGPSITFAMDRPRALKLAFQLCLTLHGRANYLGRRILLNLSLYLTYDAKVACEEDRRGVDASLLPFARAYLEAFSDHDVIGLVPSTPSEDDAAGVEETKAPPPGEEEENTKVEEEDLVDEASGPTTFDLTTFEMAEFPESNLVPTFMRWLMRSQTDFPHIVACKPLRILIRDLYRFWAMLRLVNGREMVTFDLPTQVVPPARLGCLPPCRLQLSPRRLSR